MSHAIRLSQLGKSYPGGAAALRGIDLLIPAGSFTRLVGPPGSGKSTLLRLVAGLEPVSAGRIEIGGRDVTHAAPAERGVALMFQSYALYPHMTVTENLRFGGAAARPPQFDEVVALLRLEPLLSRTPTHLSPGERQRVALGRTLLRRDRRVFLYDEPMSHLEAALCQPLILELLQLHRRSGATTIFASRDLDAAGPAGDLLVQLDAGRIAAPPQLAAA